jgi:hypothetical protein
MADSLVEQFLDEDCTDHEARLIRDAALSSSTRYLTFNRVNVEIDPVKGVARIEDELDSGREETIALQDLLARLPA